ncbi:hypothetical protein LEP1GSC169_3640 [Leptospira santarosai str. HAI1349]|nr:hypothetical protein LEP1GSC169_3640 [Leptospira santarosai str. HAI1349]
MGTAAFSFRILKQTLNQENLARYGSLIFALQRTNAFAPRLLVISLAMDRSIGRKT